MKKLLMIFAAVLALSLPAMAQGRTRVELQVGQQAPDFTLPDTQGKDVTLSSLQGKWVVLDFWGSWCGWCIKGFPQMKENYEKLSEKVWFVGVDCGDTQEKWQAAVKHYDLPWINLWENPDGDNATPAAYGIQGFPTKLIIDPKGVIRNITVGEDPEFYTVLDSLLNAE